MNNTFWKKQHAIKSLKKSYKGGNVKKINYFINEGFDIEKLLGFDNIFIACINDDKRYLLKFLLINMKDKEDKIIEAHKYIKEKDLVEFEKILLMYTGEISIRKKNIIKKYKKIIKKTNYL